MIGFAFSNFVYKMLTYWGLFQEIIVCAKDWKKRLEHLSSLWKIYQQKEDCAKNWLQQARSMLQEKTGDPEASIKRHNSFFKTQNIKILEECLKAGQDILAVLKDLDQVELQRSMNDMKTRWKVHFLFYRQAKAKKGLRLFYDFNFRFTV